MPGRSQRCCSYPGCRILTDGKLSRCPLHVEKAWQKTGKQTERVFKGDTLQRMRMELFRRNPLCVSCETHGRVTLATQRDHIIPLAEGGADTVENTQGLCVKCHDTKSLEERERGTRRKY